MQGHKFLVITIFLVVLLTIFHSGEALKCYQCSSIRTKTCEDVKLISNETTSCSTKCVRYIQNISREDVIFRLCSERENLCVFLNNVYPETVKNCFECSEDLCNASATNAISTIIMVTSGLITLLWTIQ